jgi:membrane glycosyltransferase
MAGNINIHRRINQQDPKNRTKTPGRFTAAAGFNFIFRPALAHGVARLLHPAAWLLLLILSIVPAAKAVTTHYLDFSPTSLASNAGPVAPTNGFT